MKGFLKAFRLELKHIAESKARFLSYILIPAVITVVLGEAGSKNCSWCGGYTYFNYYAPLIFSTSMIFISTQLTVLRIVGERAPYGTLDRDLLAISHPSMLLGKFFAGIPITMLQCFFFLAIGKGYYDMTMEGSPYLFFLTLFMLSLLGLALGLFFSVIAKTKEQAVQLVPLVILVFLVLSGDLIPLQDVPSFMRQFATYSPVTLANATLKEIMLNGKAPGDIINQSVNLLGWILVLLVLSIIKFSQEKK